MYFVFVFPKGQYESKYGSKSNSMKIAEKHSPMARETWVQSQVESYQSFKKWYLMPPCLTLSIIRYGSRVKWSNPGKRVAPFPTPWCSKLSKREHSSHLRLWSPTLLTYYELKSTLNVSVSVTIMLLVCIYQLVKLNFFD